MNYASHSGTSPIPKVPKLLLIVNVLKLHDTCEETHKTQTWFRTSHGRIDQIFILQQLCEHHLAFQSLTIVGFLDIRAAFDSVDISAL